MGLSQWDIVKGHTGIQATYDLAALSGATALHIARDGTLPATNEAFGITFRPNSTFTRGLLRGRVRTQARYRPGVGTFLMAMQSTGDITGSSGACYFAGLSWGTATWLIEKVTLGLHQGDWSATNFTLLSSSTSNVPATNAPFTMELSWAYDTSLFGGTSLVLRTGTQMDFSNLAVAISSIDTSSPLATSVGEGLISWPYYGLSGSPTTVFSLYDNTSIYSF